MKYSMPLRDLCRLIGKEPVEVIESMDYADRIKGSLRALRLAPSDVRDVLTSLGFSYQPQTLAFMNLKGGVGKTTSVVTMATRAVQYGFRTCVVDLDAQGSASLALGVIPGEDDLIFQDVWQSPAETVGKALIEIEDSLSVLPSALENSLLDVSLINPASQKRAVKCVCDEIRELGFDIIVIDCPPSLGTAVISAACAADIIIVPVGNDEFSFRGIQLTVEEVGAIRETFGLDNAEIRVLSTMVDKRQTLAGRSLARLAETYGGRVLPGIIRTSTEFSKALDRSETVFASARKSNAKADYDTIARAILGLADFFQQDGFILKTSVEDVEPSGTERLSAEQNDDSGEQPGRAECESTEVDDRKTTDSEVHDGREERTSEPA